MLNLVASFQAVPPIPRLVVANARIVVGAMVVTDDRLYKKRCE